jgi:hypothetical protein
MRLASILATLAEPGLQKLATEHVRHDEALTKTQLCNYLESAIRSYSFVNDFIVNRQPPTFALLTTLLNSPGYTMNGDEARASATERTRILASLIDSGELVTRDKQLHLYRKAFYEARRNDLDVNGSEAGILGVLRREQMISQVEHFLIEHHQDFREYWDRSDSLSHEESALTSCGLIFELDGKLMIPEDVAPAVFQTLGIDMPTESARRLYSHLSNEEAAEILEAAGCRTSGSKDARLERLLTQMIQPRFALQCLGLATLRDICRSSEAAVTGNKEDLIERIVAHFAEGLDQVADDPQEAPRVEERALTQLQFETLFNALLHQELSDILRRLPDLRQTGTKEIRIKTLWHAHLSEKTLLAELMNRQLEDLLARLGLRLGGSKEVRIDRLISYFSEGELRQEVSLESAQPTQANADPTVSVNEDIRANQALFQQKSSNPQASLQPWMDQILDARGLVRCYATDDPNPTKQLKNKLSQAASAVNGLLVLLLSNSESYSKAREALVERWMTNIEWPKTLACIALAYPAGTPEIAVVIQRCPSSWPHAIKEKLFPSVEVVELQEAARPADLLTASRLCASCGFEVSIEANFCSNCGARSFSG